jgi:hypothetical protein
LARAGGWRVPKFVEQPLVSIEYPGRGLGITPTLADLYRDLDQAIVRPVNGQDAGDNLSRPFVVTVRHADLGSLHSGVRDAC